MSDNMIVREVPSVTISGREAGDEFADAAADTQADFFRGMMSAINDRDRTQTWPAQCQFIAAELSANDRLELAGRLVRLVEYLTPGAKDS